MLALRRMDRQAVPNRQQPTSNLRHISQKGEGLSDTAAEALNIPYEWLNKSVKGVVLAQGNMPTLQRNWGKLQETSVRAVKLAAEISTQDLQNMKQDRDIWSQPI
jgi:hypothetical protein